MTKTVSRHLQAMQSMGLIDEAKASVKSGKDAVDAAQSAYDRYLEESDDFPTMSTRTEDLLMEELLELLA